jgi:ATP-dependent RNA helicase SUPV3L1/SUV3
VFYTFTWSAHRTARTTDATRKNTKPRVKPQFDTGGKGQAKKGPGRDPKAESFQARPPRKEKLIDPDNPFAAALMGFKKSE